MNPPIIANYQRQTAAQSGRWLLRLLLLTFALGLFFLAAAVYGITSFLRLGSDERALRNGLLKASAEHWNKRGELNLGTVTCSIARTGLAFARLEPQAKTALSCFRAGEIGFYELERRHDDMDRAAMLSAADSAMQRRGWERLVGVVDPHDFVLVYLPKKLLDADDFKACVAVIEEGRLFVGSVRGDLEPLMELVREDPDGRWRRKLPFRPIEGRFTSFDAR